MEMEVAVIRPLPQTLGLVFRTLRDGSLTLLTVKGYIALKGAEAWEREGYDI